MNSKKQKILHEVGGLPMVAHVFKAASAVSEMPPVLVIAPGEDGLRKLFGSRAEYVVQAKQLGTGHATMMAKPSLESRADQVLVTYADMPLLRATTMKQLAEKQVETGAVVTMLIGKGEASSSFGRVVRDNTGRIAEIVEVAEAKQRPNAGALLAIKELNVGVYCFAADWLWSHLPLLPARKARSGREYYLTDLIGLSVSQGRTVEAIVAEEPDECLGAGTRAELVKVEKAFRRRANNKWLSAGVTLVDPETTYIDQGVTIGQDTIIWPNTYLQGETVVGPDCVLGPNAILRNARLGHGCRVEQAMVENTTLDDGTIVPPYRQIGA